MSTPNKPKSTSSVALDKFHEIEIQKVFDTMLTIQNLRVQIGTFFGTANLTAIGIAFNFQKAGVIFLAALSLWLFIYVDLIGRGTLLRFYYRAIILQERFAPEDNDTFLDIILPPYFETEIRQILKIPKSADRLRSVQNLKFRRPNFAGFSFPLIASIVEIGIGVVLLFALGWSPF